MDTSRLFQSSVVRDENGDLAAVYHGTRLAFEQFDPNATRDGGLHFGTLSQAGARGAGKGKRIVQAYLNIKAPKRLRDDGDGWATKIKAAKRSKHDGIVYLNRHEGIELATIVRAEELGIDLDKLSDVKFKLFAPEAHDSWIVFEKLQIKVISYDMMNEPVEGEHPPSNTLAAPSRKQRP